MCVYFKRKRKSVPHVEENREKGSHTRKERIAKREPLRERRQSRERVVLVEEK